MSRVTHNQKSHFEAIHFSARRMIEHVVLPELNKSGAFFAVGNIQASALISVSFDDDTGLSALRKIALGAGLAFSAEDPADGPILIHMVSP